MEFLKKTIPSMGDKSAETHFCQVKEKGSNEEMPFPPFTFVATGSGVRWEGKTTTIQNMQDLQDMAKVASEAWKEHLRLKPRIEITKELP